MVQYSIAGRARAAKYCRREAARQLKATIVLHSPSKGMEAMPLCTIDQCNVPSNIK